MEAQWFPEDFDGLVVGAPALPLDRVHDGLQLGLARGRGGADPA